MCAARAVIIYSFFVPGGRSHSASDRAGIFDFQHPGQPRPRRDDHRCDGHSGQRQFDPEGAPEGPASVPVMAISQDEGFMLRDMLAAGRRSSCI